MRILVYSSHEYDQAPLRQFAKKKHELVFIPETLNVNTAELSAGFDAVSLFTSDDASALVIDVLARNKVKYIALRSVGYDHVDLKAAAIKGIKVANVPEYSPYAIAEHAVAMMMAANRRIADSRLLMLLQDFRLDSLTGFDVHGKTVGVIGTGKIGMAFASIMKGFGVTLLACDPVENEDAIKLGVQYTTLDELLQRSDIVSIHCPLNPATRYLLSKQQFAIMKKGAVLINTARGGVIKTADLVDAIDKGILSVVCLDVYENEKGLFFEDHRNDVITDPLFARLRSYRNVMITGHQGFLTNEALAGIASVTVSNIDHWENGRRSLNELVVHAN